MSNYSYSDYSQNSGNFSSYYSEGSSTSSYESSFSGKEQTDETVSSVTRVAQVLLASVVCGFIAVVIAHFGGDFPWGGINTIGTGVGTALAGGIMAYFILEKMDKYADEIRRGQDIVHYGDENNSDDGSTTTAVNEYHDFEDVQEYPPDTIGGPLNNSERKYLYNYYSTRDGFSVQHVQFQTNNHPKVKIIEEI